MELAKLWFVYIIAVAPDGGAAITPPNLWLNAPTREECLPLASALANDMAADTVGPLTFYPICLEMDASLAGELN